MERLITDPSILEGYLTDASNIRGDASGLVRPRSIEEIAAVVRHCQAHGIPLTVTAGRTSTTAASVPFGGWLLSTEHLDQIHHIGHDRASADAGVLLGAFQDAVEQSGRFYPPDPTSRHDCTLGASIATNASGARTFRYGPSRDWVTALTVVLPTGDVVEARRGMPIPPDWPVPTWEEPAVKTAAGYAPPQDLVDLFIGQEGTLGIIARVEVRLTDLPDAVLGIVAYFRDRETAVTAVGRLRAEAAGFDGPVCPRCIEYLDAPCLDLARQRVPGVPDDARAALFCEQEVLPALDEDDHLGAWWELLEELGALADDTLVTTDEAGRADLHAFRHAIPAGINERVVRNGMPKVGTDLAVPHAALPEMMELYEAAPLEHLIFGHIGDSHLHLNMLPTTAEELDSAKAYYDQLARRAIALGGTVSAEHGIGKTKRHYLEWMVGAEVMSTFQALKAHLDPAEVLGRGNILPPPTEEA